MCGIAGFCLANDKLDSRVLACNLLVEIEARGKDATGAAWYDPSDGQVWYLKAPVRARDFVVDLLDAMPRNAQTVVLHTRYATQGSPAVEENNHPIVRDGVVGVHNGHISNDDVLFQRLGVERFGEVDSEAAFALIESVGEEQDAIAGVLPELRGGAALAWMATADGKALQLARVKSSPLAVAQSKTGHFVFASTMPMLMRASGKSGLGLTWREELPEGAMLRVRGGLITDWTSFEPPVDAYRMPSYSGVSKLAPVAATKLPAAWDEEDDLTDEEWDALMFRRP